MRWRGKKNPSSNTRNELHTPSRTKQSKPQSLGDSVGREYLQPLGRRRGGVRGDAAEEEGRAAQGEHLTFGVGGAEP